MNRDIIDIVISTLNSIAIAISVNMTISSEFTVQAYQLKTNANSHLNTFGIVNNVALWERHLIDHEIHLVYIDMLSSLTGALYFMMSVTF